MAVSERCLHNFSKCCNSSLCIFCLHNKSPRPLPIYRSIDGTSRLGSSSTDSEEEESSEEEAEFQLETSRNASKSTRRGKRSIGGAAADGSCWDDDSSCGLPRYSLCQLWRYRLLLEVIGLARSADDANCDEGESEGRRGGTVVRPGPRLVEVRNDCGIVGNIWWSFSLCSAGVVLLPAPPSPLCPRIEIVARCCAWNACSVYTCSHLIALAAPYQCAHR